MIHKSLFEVTDKSLAVETVVELASKLFDRSAQDGDAWKRILPNLRQWNDVVDDFLSRGPPQSLVISDELGGALYLVNASTNPGPGSSPSTYDAEGESSALRILRYTLALLKLHPQPPDLEPSVQRQICRLATLTLQMVNDKISLAEANEISLLSHGDAGHELASLLAEGRKIAMQLVTGDRNSRTEEGFVMSSATDQLLNGLLSTASNRTNRAFHEARAYSVVISDIIETHGWNKSGEPSVDQRFKSLRQDGHALQLASFLAGHQQILHELPSLIRYANELIANLTGLDATTKSQSVLESLVLLNIIIRAHGEVLEAMAKQRLVFFVKQLTSWLAAMDIRQAIKAEAAKSLASVLPHIVEIYGEHWQSMLTWLGSLWAESWERTIADPSTAGLPLLHASLKLLSVLRHLTQTSSSEESNEDLTEAWTDTAPGLSSGLINILKQSGAKSDDANQPLRTVNDLLARQIGDMPPASMEHLAELFPLLQAMSHAVQETAFAILHRQIPRLQEQVSLDTALDKSMAQLPEELLSLVLQSPDIDQDLKEELDFANAPTLFGYLASWLLVFDHFKNAVSFLLPI